MDRRGADAWVLGVWAMVVCLVALWNQNEGKVGAGYGRCLSMGRGNGGAFSEGVKVDGQQVRWVDGCVLYG